VYATETLRQHDECGDQAAIQMNLHDKYTNFNCYLAKPVQSQRKSPTGLRAQPRQCVSARGVPNAASRHGLILQDKCNIVALTISAARPARDGCSEHQGRARAQ